MKKKLNKRQKVFVQEYLKDLNATAAYKRAGFKASGHSAETNAARLLRNAEVSKAIQAGMDARAKRAELDSDQILKEIGRLSYINPKKLFDAQGRLLPIHQLPDEIAVCISSLDVVTTRVPGSDPVEVEYTTKIKFWDKRGSLELLGKHQKLFTDKLEVTRPEHEQALEELA